MDQSGPMFDRTASYQGQDNYFNHSQYLEGWSYLGRTIGTPFITPQSDVQLAAKGARFFPNNRLNMAYIGASGQFGKFLRWTFRTSYSVNYGTYTNPYPVSYNQLSSLVGLQLRVARLPKTIVTASLAVDQGQLLPNTFGGFLGLRKTW
jgi:hypothetical protein